jgi:hypothetical protein
VAGGDEKGTSLAFTKQFENIKKGMKLHSVKITRESGPADCESGSRDLEHFKKLLTRMIIYCNRSLTFMRQSCFGRKYQHVH